MFAVDARIKDRLLRKTKGKEYRHVNTTDFITASETKRGAVQIILLFFWENSNDDSGP